MKMSLNDALKFGIGMAMGNIIVGLALKLIVLSMSM